MIDLKVMGDEILSNKLAHGWKVTGPDDWCDPHEVPAVLSLIHSEVSEALEAFREKDIAHFAEELADVMIRTVGLSHGLEIDLEFEIAKKMLKNKNRPFQHGGKRI